MTVSSIWPGRLPQSLIAQRQTKFINSNSAELARLQQQVSSGQRFVLPSEEPSSALKAIMLQKSLERTAHFKQNVEAARSYLSATESALSEVADALNRAKSLALAGVGSTLTASEKEGLAVEVASLLQSVLSTANTRFRGRYLFGGGSGEAPFQLVANGQVRYNGDLSQLTTFADLDLTVATNVDGASAFAAVTEAVGGDLSPALSLQSRLADLHRGSGVTLGAIRITLDDGVTQQTATVDLTGAETIADVKTRIEAAFSSGPLSLSVDIDPSTRSALRLTPSAGTVSVADLDGSTVARDLGILGGPASQLVGQPLDPQISFHTAVSDLNGGGGVDLSSGLTIQHGSVTQTVDLSSAQTVGDLVQLLQAADPNLLVRIDPSRNGLVISSRLSGTPFSIGENGGSTASDLKVRTFTGATRLDELNGGLGVPLDSGQKLEITRRDGSTVSIDLSTAITVQDVLDAINSVDPGHLVAQLNTVGNGISLFDDSGTGSLVVKSNSVSTALGLAGEEDSGDPTNPLVGQDVHTLEPTGVFTILAELETALRNGDDRQLQRLDKMLDAEIERFSQVRADVGARLKMLDEVENRVLDREVALKEQLSGVLDTDMTQAVVDLVRQQQALEATLMVTAQTYRLNLLSFL